MIQEFNKITTASNFIKNLLISTYLPLIRTVRDFDYIIKDRLYVYKCEIIKCTRSGYLVTGIKNFSYSNVQTAAFRSINEYYFGERNGKLCTNYISNSEGYDSLTHERLGKYLRNLRDMYGLNLMPLYNCFSNQILRAHHISSSNVEKTSIDYNTKIYKVPIRFNTDYTICMDNPNVTTFAPAFIKNNNLILLNNTRFGNGVDATNKYIKLHQTRVIQNKSGLRFKAPFVLRFNNVPETKQVEYFETTISELDYLHDDRFYKKNKPEFNKRFKYYLKNDGTYNIVTLTEEEFNANKTTYYYNNNGIITQCTNESIYDSNIIYYIAKELSFGHTYLVTDLTPDSAEVINLNTILYVGVDPSTGRIDSTYNVDKWYFRRNGEVIETDIETQVEDSSLEMDEDEVSAEYIADNQLKVSTNLLRLFDSPDFQTVCLYERCSAYHKYSDSEVYYERVNGLFEVWDYEFTEEEFNSNKSFYYVKDGEDYIRCNDYSEYDSSTTYYVYYNDAYILPEEYHFDINRTNFYLTDGFKDNPENYYVLTNGKFVKNTEPFDINSTYAIVTKKEIFPWRVKDSSGHLIYSSDTYIVDGTTYYSSFDTESKEYYVYDITEENCALYDYLEDNLYLLIQVPKSFESSIIILEGDYTNTQSEKIITSSEVSMLPDALVDYIYTSNLKLMQMPTTMPIPFSSTLIEFLLWHAICNLDSINNNMDRLALSVRKILHELSNTKYANFWNAEYRKYVSDIGRYHNNIVVTDNLGYVTNNLEQVINTASNSDSYINQYPYRN